MQVEHWHVTALRITRNKQAEAVVYDVPSDYNVQTKTVLLDLFTASMLCHLASELNPENSAALKEMPLWQAVDVGWRVVNNAIGSLASKGNDS